MVYRHNMLLEAVLISQTRTMLKSNYFLNRSQNRAVMTTDNALNSQR